MSDLGPLRGRRLLWLCATLRRFEAALLRDLGAEASAADALLAGDAVTAAPGFASQVSLRPQLRDGALAELRAEQPGDEIAFHRRAFELYRGRAALSAGAPDQDECVYHLTQLFKLLSVRMAWQTIAVHTQAARSALVQERHVARLDVYDGIVAIWTKQYERGQRALVGALERPELEPDVRMGAISNLGNMFLMQSRYDQALLWYREQQAFAQAIGDRTAEGLALINIGTVYNDLDDYERAYRHSAESLAIFREQGDRVREVYALYAMGRDALHMGRWQLAQEHYEQATPLSEALELYSVLIALYWGRGFLRHMQGDEAEAERWYHQALELARRPESSQPSVEMDVFLRLGFLYRTQSRWDEALAALESAARLANVLEKRHRLVQIGYQRGRMFWQQGRLAEAETAFREAIETIETLRGATEGEAIKIALLGTAQQVYEAMVLLCLERGRPADAFAYVERARSRAFLDALARKSPELHDALDLPTVGVAELQARLTPGTLLLEYFCIGVQPRGEHSVSQIAPANGRLREQLTLPPQTWIFAVSSDSFEAVQAPLDPNTLRAQPGDPGPVRRLLRERMLSLLHERLLGPVAERLAGRELLYLVPHGPLHHVPFAALRDAEGAPLLDERGPALALAPSATVLCACLDRPTQRGQGFLALGYNDPAAEPLRYAEREAKGLARLMGGQAWTGAEPKQGRLAEEGQRARWLHIAGHATYDPADPLGSAVMLGADETLSARAIIGGLDLRADLVTLSACASGLSTVASGDELLGLQRALLYAGAPTVVAALWETADLVALLVMERFYGAVRAGAAPAIALRDAVVAVRGMTGRELAGTLERWRADDPATANELPVVQPEQYDTHLYSDPFLWAPFVLIGRPW